MLKHLLGNLRSVVEERRMLYKRHLQKQPNFLQYNQYETHQNTVGRIDAGTVENMHCPNVKTHRKTVRHTRFCF